MVHRSNSGKGTHQQKKQQYQKKQSTHSSSFDSLFEQDLDDDAYLDMVSRRRFFASIWRLLKNVSLLFLTGIILWLAKEHFDKIQSKPRTPHGGPSFDVRPFRVLGNISVAEFEANYAGSGVALPTLFKDATRDVFRPHDWTRRNLYKRCGSAPLVQPHRKPECQDEATAKKNPSCHHVRIVHENFRGKTWGGTHIADLKDDLPSLKTVKDVLELQDRSPLGHEVVLFDAPLLHHCPSLQHRVRVPKYFPRDYYLLLDWWMGHDPRETRNWPSIIVSKKGGGTYLHADSGMTRFWAQQLSGRKRWRVFPLRESHNLAPSPHLHYYYPIIFELDAFHPDFYKYPDANGVVVYEQITEPGDLIFIPEGWAHQVENLEDSVITSMNFLDNHAIETATRELPYSLHHTHNVELFSAFFFPLDNPVHANTDHGENIVFDAYFSQRFLAHETEIPQSVIEWVKMGGATAIDMERDTWQLPALHVAVYFNYFCVLQFLIEVGGANVNVEATDRVTALDFAEWTGRWEMRDLLRYQYGARGRLDRWWQ